MTTIVYFDTWVQQKSKKYWAKKVCKTKKINDIKSFFQKDHFLNFTKDADYFVCHNYFWYDINVLYDLKIQNKKVIDTLYLDNLFFINEKRHNLVKSENNDVEEDAESTQERLSKIFVKFKKTNNRIQNLFYNLLKNKEEFKYFFNFVKNYWVNLQDYDKEKIRSEVLSFFENLPNENEFISKIDYFIENHSTEIAFCIAYQEFCNNQWWFSTWLHKTYPKINILLEKIMFFDYEKISNKYLRIFFWFDNFRKINWKNIQQEWVISALRWENVLLWLPTGWWKSITFQLPALIQAELLGKLTIVISPLKSLMKDQVDSLKEKWIYNVDYKNSDLNLLEREKLDDKIINWEIDILYITPESLRSESFKKTIEKRNIDRFVIDESHCIITWGADFRTDYLWIPKFIQTLKNSENIKISCFSATNSKDILSWIQKTFNRQFSVYTSSAKRDNLTYSIQKIDKEEYKRTNLLKFLEKINIEQNPTIIFARKTVAKDDKEEIDYSCVQNLAEFLDDNWINCKGFHWKMSNSKKIEIQDKFMRGKINLIVATKAFGMWVDKANVRYVIHYNMPLSLEDYLQEAGRAWRDNQKSLCKAFFSDQDIQENKKFNNMWMVYYSQIKKVFEYLSQYHNQWDVALVSPSNLARYIWIIDDTNYKTKVKFILMVLEKAGYIERQFDKTQVFINRNEVKDIKEWENKIENNPNFTEEERTIWKEIINQICNFRSFDINEFAIKKEKKVIYIKNIIEKLERHKILSKADDECDLMIKIDLNLKRGIWTINLLEKYESIFDYIKEIMQKENKLTDKVLYEKILHNWYSEDIPKVKTLINFLIYSKILNFKDWYFYWNVEKINKAKKYFIKSRYLLNFFDKDDTWYKQREIKFSYKMFNEYLKLKNLEIMKTTDIKKLLLFLHKLSIIKVVSWLMIFSTKYTIQIITDKKEFAEEDFEYVKKLYKDKDIKSKAIQNYFEKFNLLDDRNKFIQDYFDLSLSDFSTKYL